MKLERVTDCTACRTPHPNGYCNGCGKPARYVLRTGEQRSDWRFFCVECLYEAEGLLANEVDALEKIEPMEDVDGDTD